MQQMFDQALHYVQQGIAAIFHFVELVWSWSAGQITKLTAVPWQEWPLLKQILLVLIIAGVVWALYSAAREIVVAGTAILGAIATLLGVLVQTLPSVLLAGIIALGGVWLVNHLDNSAVQLPMAFQRAPSPDNTAGSSASPANGAPANKPSPGPTPSSEPSTQK
jgi:hypothetical protein